MKTVTFVTYTSTGKYTEEIELSNADDDESIKNIFLNWLCEHNSAYWIEEE